MVYDDNGEIIASLIVDEYTGETVEFTYGDDNSLIVTYSDGRTASFRAEDYSENMLALFTDMFGEPVFEKDYEEGDSEMLYINIETGEIAEESQHNYNYTFEDGTICENGYNLSYVCDKCGDSGTV
jgi:hypothetical protein